MLKIQVILGSVREGRFGEKPAKWIMGELSKREGIESELIDLKDWSLPFFNEPASPSTSGGKYVNPLGRKWANKIGEADGFIIVTPEYNHGYSAVLKNALDWAFAEWNKKPVSFISYGGIAAGTRAVQQLRQVAIELQMVPIRNGVHLPLYWSNLDENGQIKTDQLKESGDKMIAQLVEYAEFLKMARDKSQ